MENLSSQREKGEETGKKPEKTQEELRDILKQRFESLRRVVKDGIREFKEALEDGTFKDQEDEPEGAGEARKQAMYERTDAILDKARKIKETLESGEPLSQITEEIQAQYTHPDGREETITLNLEEKLQEFISFYQQVNLDLPPDFEDTIKDIWERNQDEIQKAIEEKGFDGMLVIPGNIPLTELKDKMFKEEEYNLGQNFKNGGSFAGVVSQKVDRPRLILYHKIDSLPEISRQTGLDVHLNITGEDAEKLYQSDPESYLATLEDFLILERKHLEETGKHLSDWRNKSANWLPGSKVGSRLVDSYWSSDDHGFDVRAHVPEYRFEDLGVRPTRCFF